MKKLLVLLCLFALVSCEKDDCKTCIQEMTTVINNMVVSSRKDTFVSCDGKIQNGTVIYGTKKYYYKTICE